MEQFWVVMARWVQEHAPNFAKNQASAKKFGREVPRVRSQLTMRDETQPTSCGLCFNTSSYVILVKFLRSQFFVHLSVQKIFHRSIRQNRRRP